MLQLLSNYIFPSYLAEYPEIVMSLAYKIKKFEFWHPRLMGTPHCGTPKICQILYFLYIHTQTKFKNKKSNSEKFISDIAEFNFAMTSH